MKRVMIVGGVGSGKSTLTEALLQSGTQVVKTQALNFRQWIVDTPGEYTENPLYYRSLMATTLEVEAILLVQDATSDKLIFPPGFTSGLPKLTIGVVTKADSPLANINKAFEFLRQAMPIGQIIVTSSHTGQGLSDLTSFLN